MMARPRTVIGIGTALMLASFAAGLAIQQWMTAIIRTYNLIGSCLFLVGGLIVIVGCGMLAYSRSLMVNVVTGLGLATTGSLIVLSVRLDNSWTVSLFIPALTLVADGLVMLVVGV